jgi:hypothetical protein
MDLMNLKTLLCFAIGPIVPPLSLASFLVIADGNWQGALGILILGSILCYSIAIFLALPAHLILRRLGLTGATVYALVGFVLGALTPGLLEYSIYYGLPPKDYFRPSFDSSFSIVGVLFGMAGLFVALVFWLIVQPDAASAQTKTAGPAKDRPLV